MKSVSMNSAAVSVARAHPKRLRDEAERQPVVRMRSVLAGLCVLVVCMAVPLVLVWKQSYINQVSLRLEGKAGALAAVNREITSLGLECGRLSSTARIERIARQKGLEYPTSGQLEVLEVRAPRQGGGGFLARVKKTFFGEKAGGSV
jgi:cell division protein FtsL